MPRLDFKKPIIILILVVLTLNNFGFSILEDGDVNKCILQCRRFGDDNRYNRGPIYGQDDDDDDDYDDDGDQYLGGDKYESGDDDDDNANWLGRKPSSSSDSEVDGDDHDDVDVDDGQDDDDKYYGPGEDGSIADDDDDDDPDQVDQPDEIEDEIEEQQNEKEFIDVDQEVSERVDQLLKSGNYSLPYFTDFADAPEDMSNTTDRGMVTSSDVRCSRVGAQILRRGGSVSDATVGSMACLTVVELGSTGMTGGGISLSYINNRFKTVDFRPRDTKIIVSRRRFRRCRVGRRLKVHGMPRGLFKIWKQGGKLPWKSLFDIPILMAYHGFEIKPSLSRVLKINQRRLRRDRYLREILFMGKCIKKTGGRIVNKRLARVLHEMSKNYTSMYVGRIPRIMARKINKKMEKEIVEEIEKYEPQELETLDVDLDEEHKMVTTSKDTGGPLLGYMIDSAKQFKETHSEEFHADGSVEDEVYLKTFDTIGNSHCLAPHLTNGDAKSVLDGLFKKNGQSGINIPESRRLTSHKCPLPDEYDEEEEEEEDIGGSVNLNVVDECGNGISVQSGINKMFGGKFSFGSLGMIGNPLTLVGMDRRRRCRRFRRLRKGMMKSFYTPTIVIENKNKTLSGVFSGAGGRKIPSAVAQVMGSHYYRGLSLNKSIRKFRMFSHYRNNKVYSEVDKPIPRRVKRLLRRRRMAKVRRIPRVLSSSVSGISIKRDKFKRRRISGAADFRKNGGICSA